MSIPSNISQPGANLYTQGFGSRPENVEVPHLDVRAPASSDVNYPLGKRWINTASGLSYSLNAFSTAAGLTSATWAAEATLAGPLNTLTGDSGGAIVPVAGNITLAGTAGQAVTAGSPGTITFSLPAAVVAPGSLTTTTTLTAGTDLTVNGNTALVGNLDVQGTIDFDNGMDVTGGLTADTLGVTGLSTLAATTIVGTALINASGANNTTIGTGGTGFVRIGNTTGNTSVTGSLAATTGLSTSTGNIVATAGQVNAGTTMTAGTGITATAGGVTATAGNITANGGDIITVRSDAGNTVKIEATNSDNTNGASDAAVEIATGGAASGDPSLSFQISGVGASTMSMGLDNSASDIFVISNSTALGTSNALTLTQAGALTATTSITATLGAITATNGNLVLGTAGNKIVSTSVAANTATAGANSFGTTTLIGGTITVATSAVTANSLIMIWRQSVGATGAAGLGVLSVGTITAATSFVINSWTPADATALQVSDVSVVGWVIIN